MFRQQRKEQAMAGAPYSVFVFSVCLYFLEFCLFKTKPFSVLLLPSNLPLSTSILRYHTVGIAWSFFEYTPMASFVWTVGCCFFNRHRRSFFTLELNKTLSEYIVIIGSIDFMFHHFRHLRLIVHRSCCTKLCASGASNDEFYHPFSGWILRILNGFDAILGRTESIILCFTAFWSQYALTRIDLTVVLCALSTRTSAFVDARISMEKWIEKCLCSGFENKMEEYEYAEVGWKTRSSNAFTFATLLHSSVVPAHKFLQICLP